MAYTIIQSDGTTVYAVIADGTANTRSGISLPGKNYSGYGNMVDTTIVHMLEHFASTTAPGPAPLRGQLWFNTGVGQLNVFDGTTWNPLQTGGGTGTFNDLNVTGNITAGNITAQKATFGILAAAGSGSTITGNWTLAAGAKWQSSYADLAERYHSDSELSEGTVVRIGGEYEITATTSKADVDQVLGVVSKKYAYLMNSEAGTDNTHPPIGLVGRVPVRVVGPITRGQRVTTCTTPGCAVASMSDHGFGWALESNASQEEKLVLCVIK